MNFEFLDNIPQEMKEKAILISGNSSASFPSHLFLLVREAGEVSGIFQIRFEFYNGPFSKACMLNNLLAVGYSGHFYLYDLAAKYCLLILPVDAYFSDLAASDDFFYVAGSGSVHCINKQGNLVWKNTSLGIDGVIIQQITDLYLYGRGEWDPPGDWRDFVIDRGAGKSVQVE